MSRTAKEIGFVEAKDHNLVKRKDTADDKWLMELNRKERMDFLNIKEEK